jgi:vacuolar-type H+-ATPase subunit E/Vma4
MEQPPLEESIRRESEEAVRAIREKEAAEIGELDAACAAGIEDFRKKTEAETRAKIEHERSRLESKGLLERRKLKLRGLEDFIGRMVEEAVGVMRDDPRYKAFLLDRVRDAAGEIQSGMEVLLAKEDLVLEQEVVAAAKESGRPDAIVGEDPAIRWGGCVIRDESAGRIFNSAIERVHYRRSATIRREITRILGGKGFSF